MLNLLELRRNFVQAVRRNTRHVETYYDVLQVSTDCTGRDIKQAFVQLSKKFHPDVKGHSQDPVMTEQFVKISEAYHTLSKPNLRNAYDQRLWARGVLGPHSNVAGGGLQTTELHKPWEVHPNYDPKPGPYYGFKGLEKVSNSKIAWVLISLGLFGAVFGFASVKHSFTMNRQQLDEVSAEASTHHAAVRAEAVKFGNEEQLRRMVDRMAISKR